MEALGGSGLCAETWRPMSASQRKKKIAAVEEQLSHQTPKSRWRATARENVNTVGLAKMSTRWVKAVIPDTAPAREKMPYSSGREGLRP